MTEYAITTVDNPFNPFDQFVDWFLFDVTKGYNSCGMLARLAITSDKFSDQENFDSVSNAIDRIIALDPFNMYRKVERKVNFDEIHNTKVEI